MAKYLTGATHYLTKEEAEIKYPENGYNELVLEDDGTYSAYHLADKPRVYGQVEWVGNKKSN